MTSREKEVVLRVDGLQVAYRQNGISKVVLNDLDLELRSGEIVALLGESGSGKSTIAKAITGLLPPSAQIQEGTLQLASEPPIHLNRKDTDWERIRGRRLGMLFQDARLALNPVLKIKEHFRESLLFHRLAAPQDVLPIASALLSKLNFADPGRVLESYPFQLSGGMCQRVCLALSLSLQPAVLIADEPTSALDTVSQREVLELLLRLQAEQGQTVLLITHDLAVAKAVSNRVLVLREGRMEEQGLTSDVLLRPKSAYTRQLLDARSHRLKPLVLKPGRAIVLEASQLHKHYGRASVLQGVDLSVAEGEIVGILGESGCGKSTLARCLTGLERPDGGSIRYHGKETIGLRGRQKRELCKQVQMVFQDARASLNPGRTALQLVQEPLRYLKLGGRKEREAMAAYYLHEAGITDEAQHRRPPQLSTGQCQRIAIARALVVQPDILICDEAVSALDMSVQAQILKLLQRLNRRFGFSIIMISHDIRVLQSFCHVIAVMHQGHFCELKPGASLHTSEEAYTQTLLRCAGDMEAGL
ncbi:ABC transporter ATP-binding protein [Paenibacillus daejeonensis]|uniref:ABC transporter ATP-binding protein n=1 Tax=Paenibacillus daejeonensis TaxID=135193 RepID=UPI000375CD1B|nr:ABC transporter ATP-binding protein [Paenibacillus daejeonensis]